MLTKPDSLNHHNILNVIDDCVHIFYPTTLWLRNGFSCHMEGLFRFSGALYYSVEEQKEGAGW